MTAYWTKCQGNVWCELNRVDLSAIGHIEGVYIIWHGGTPPVCVRVGQGVIKERLAEHRKDPAIQAYAPAVLYFTWAAVSRFDRDGVEAFLSAQYRPLVGERFSNRKQISIDLPA